MYLSIRTDRSKKRRISGAHRNGPNAGPVKAESAEPDASLDPRVSCRSSRTAPPPGGRLYHSAGRGLGNDVMDISDGSVREITAEAEFGAVRTGVTGYFVVTDRSTPTRIHALDCYAVGDSHFRTKVIVNARRRGRYYFVSSVDVARTRFPKGLPCGLCHPFPQPPRLPPPPHPTSRL